MILSPPFHSLQCKRSRHNIRYRGRLTLPVPLLRHCRVPHSTDIIWASPEPELIYNTSCPVCFTFHWPSSPAAVLTRERILSKHVRDIILMDHEDIDSIFINVGSRAHYDLPCNLLKEHKLSRYLVRSKFRPFMNTLQNIGKTIAS